MVSYLTLLAAAAAAANQSRRSLVCKAYEA